MPLEKVATWKRANQGRAVHIIVDGYTLEITHNDLARLNTEAKVQKEIDRLARLNDVTLPIFAHVNRDRSIAIATGIEPDVWPEDEIDPGETNG